MLGNHHGKRYVAVLKRSGDGKGNYNAPEALWWAMTPVMMALSTATTIYQKPMAHINSEGISMCPVQN